MSYGVKDSQIFDAFRKGSTDAFRYYFKLHHSRIYYYVLNMCKDHDYAHEFAQEAFIALYKNNHKCRDESHLLRYLYIVSKNAFLQHLRGQKGHRFVDVESCHDIKDDINLMEDPEVVRNEVLLDLQKAIQKLPTQRKKVVNAFYFEGKKIPSIAEALDINEQTARNHLARGMGSLRELLGEGRKKKLSMP